MLSLSDRINQIADDYMAFSGKGTEGKCLLTPQDYLMFRAQAIEELKIGLFTESASSTTHTTPIQTSQTLQTSSFSKNESARIEDTPKEAEEETIPTPKPIPGVTPIHQDKLNNNAVLAILKSVEG